MKIPVFAVTQKQGDTIRAHLPSKVALFVKKAVVQTNNLAVQPSDSTLKKVNNAATVQNVNLPQSQFEGDVFNKQFTLSPNPANGFINVTYQFEEPQSARIRVMNSAGEVVYWKVLEATATSGTHTIDTKNWSSGIFNVAIDHDNLMLHMEKISVVR